MGCLPKKVIVYYNDVQEKSYEISYDPDFKESSVMATMSHIFLKKTTLAPEHALPQARKIEWIYDPGTKTIYDEQPWQAAFLTSKSFTVIEKIRAKDVYESLHGNTISYSHVSGELTNHEKLLSTAEKTTDMNAYREIMKSRLGDVRTAGKKNPLFKKL